MSNNEETMQPGGFPKDIDLNIEGVLKLLKTAIPEYTSNTYIGFYNPRFVK